MAVERPDRGFMFWPVGTGDSTTIWVDDQTVLQVDLHDRGDAAEDETPYLPIIDKLKDALPRRRGRPYLSVFALTHPDEDHCKGFERLLDEVTIGEIWASPRVYRDYHKELCADASVYKDEVIRRRDATIESDGDPDAGDRLRVFGWDDLLGEDDWEGFPKHRLTIPGDALHELDGRSFEGVFRAFIHAPFKDDVAGERNDASLGMQVTLEDDAGAGRALLFGDLCYPTLRRVYDETDDDDDLRWDLLLAPHHCSKSVMYWKGEDDEEERLRRGILDDFERTAEEVGWIVASSDPIPATDEPNQNPPHAKAKRRYEEIVPNEFLCTQEFPNSESPEVLCFPVAADGISLRGAEGDRTEGASGGWSGAVAAARGSDEPPTEEVGFGHP